jgi:hypothetical protein
MFTLLTIPPAFITMISIHINSKSNTIHLFPPSPSFAKVAMLVVFGTEEEDVGSLIVLDTRLDASHDDGLLQGQTTVYIDVRVDFDF